MTERPKNFREEWRDVRGWVPWLVAAVYFPLYVALDFVAGGSVATASGVPRSVSVALFSLSITLLVTSVVIVSRLDSVSLSRAVEMVDPRTRAPTRRRSTVGASGGVNRRTVEAEHPSPPSDGADANPSVVDEGPAVQDDRSTSETDGGDEADWPEEWIPGDQV